MPRRADSSPGAAWGMFFGVLVTTMDRCLNDKNYVCDEISRENPFDVRCFRFAFS